MAAAEREPPSGPSRWLMMGAGTLSLGVAAVGAVLPLLPAFPFVLLAAACFARSSPRLHRWLREHRWFGPSLRAWEEHRALPRSTKRSALILLWVTVPVSMLLLEPRWVRIALVGVLLAGTAILARLPTVEDPPTRRSNRPPGSVAVSRPER